MLRNLEATRVYWYDRQYVGASAVRWVVGSHIIGVCNAGGLHDVEPYFGI